MPYFGSEPRFFPNNLSSPVNILTKLYIQNPVRFYSTAAHQMHCQITLFVNSYTSRGAIFGF